MPVQAFQIPVHAFQVLRQILTRSGPVVANRAAGVKLPKLCQRATIARTGAGRRGRRPHTRFSPGSRLRLRLRRPQMGEAVAFARLLGQFR